MTIFRFEPMTNPDSEKPAPIRINRERGRDWLPKEPVIIDRELHADMVHDRAEGMKGVGSGMKTGLATTALLSAWLNFVVVKENFSADMYARHKPLSGVSGEIYQNKALKDLVKDTAQDVCRVVHTSEFFARFFVLNEDGTKSLNTGAALMPLGMQISEKCKRLMTVEVTLPSEFSRKFVNIKSLTPEQEKIIIDELVKLLQERMSDEIIMRRSWEALETYAVNTGKYFNTQTGKINFDLNDTEVQSIQMAGMASDEAEIAGGARSIGRADVENARLAQQRLDDVYTLARQAFEQAGISRKAIESIKLESLERVLNDGEVAQLGEIADSIFGTNARQNYEKVFELIKAFNANDPRVLSYFSTHKAEADLFKSFVSGQRGVKIKLEVEGEYSRNNVYELLTPLPLLVLLALLYNLLTLKKRMRYADEFERLLRKRDVQVD